MSKMKFQRYDYTQSKKSNNIFDLIGDNKNSDISFVRVELPQEEFLKKQRAKYVIQSFKGKTKTLFTGLIDIGENYYYGDNLNSNGKKDFIIIYYNRMRRKIILFIFKNRNPRNKQNFISEFFDHVLLMGLLLHTF